MKHLHLSSAYAAARTILGINARNLQCIYPYNVRRLFPNVDDKLRCKQMLDKAGVPVPDTFHVVDGPSSLAAWEEMLQHRDAFVVKPNRSFGGRGIILVRRLDGGYSVSGEKRSADDITFHVRQIVSGAFALDNISDTAYFEEEIQNHPDLTDLMGEDIPGVADLRIIMRYEEPIMAMLRIPTLASDGKANLHQGGIGIGIDLASGSTRNGCLENSIIRRHPDTDRPLSGRQVPFFGEMVAIGSRICDAVGLGYVGVDFVCDRHRGPLVLEVNARPGLNIQIANETGLRERLGLCFD